jgi:phospholipid/cholesterol/gamma-HCH transport system ATP-binding protein
LKRRTLGETYSVAVFTLEELNILIKTLGHDAAQEAIRGMGLFIDKHFSAIGGFSTRRQMNEFVTVLPYSDLTEAESILNDFVDDFRERGIRDIWAGARRRFALRECVEFAILAGIAQGQPIVEIDSIIDSAKHQQKEIARFRCDIRG